MDYYYLDFSTSKNYFSIINYYLADLDSITNNSQKPYSGKQNLIETKSC